MGHRNCLGWGKGKGVRNESHVLVWKIRDPYHRERTDKIWAGGVRGGLGHELSLWQAELGIYVRGMKVEVCSRMAGDKRVS